MKKRFLKASFCTLFCLFCLFLGSLTSQAASVKKLKGTSNKSFQVSADMTNDNKKDTISFNITADSYGTNTGIKVTMGGKTVLKKTNLYFYYTEVVYIRLSKSREFLQIIATGDSNMRPLNSLYRYDKSKKKFVEVLDLTDGVGAGQEVKSATSSTIKVYNSCTPGITGPVYWYFSYKYSGGKFKRTSNTANVYFNYSFKLNDGYDSLFKNSKYKAARSVTLYTNTSLNKVSFTASSGSVLKLKKIRVAESGSSFAIYFKFTMGSKSGWIKYDSSSYNSLSTFYGVSSRTAGGFYG